MTETQKLIDCYKAVVADLTRRRNEFDIAIRVLERMRDEWIVTRRYAELAYGDAALADTLVGNLENCKTVLQPEEKRE